MKIAVFGATSPSGKCFVDLALNKGHTVTALVRDPASLPAREGMQIIQGDAMDVTAVAKTITGADAVVSYLGPKKGAPKDMIEVSTRNIIQAMEQQGVKRAVIASVGGIPMPQDQSSFLSRLLVGIMKIVIKNMFEQRRKQIELLQASRLDWVAVRLPRLIDKQASGNFALGYPRMSGKLNIARSDLAEAMLQQLTEDTWLKQAPIVGCKEAFD